MPSVSGDGILTSLRAACAAAVDLVLPVECAGCAAPAQELCLRCLAELEPDIRRFRAGGVAVTGGLVFDGVAAEAIRALKRDGRTALARGLAPALHAAVAAAGGGDGATAIVPVPPSSRAMRRRGFDVVELLLRRAGARPVRLLRRTGPVSDQRGLDRRARRRNAHGTMRACEAAAGRTVIVVDDVVTTAATLAEAARALEAAGAHVRGAATLAVTPQRTG